MVHGMEQQKNAVLSGYWPLIRYNPALREEGKNPFQLDSRPPSIPLKQYAYQETRYTMLARMHPEAAKQLLHSAEEDVHRMWDLYHYFSQMPGSKPLPEEAEAKTEEPVAAQGGEES
jgi:pyruvate-ferredoxin/flavodoxin oxidoreductase